MSEEPVDLAAIEYEDVVYTAGADEISDRPPLRLMKAIAAGEVTLGGLAEAGWRDVGTIAEDGLKFRPTY